MTDVLVNNLPVYYTDTSYQLKSWQLESLTNFLKIF